MLLDVLMFVAGLALSGLALRDVFETVVVPGGNRSSLRVAHRLVGVLLPVWKMLRGRARGLSGTFAPMVLVVSFFLWISLLSVGFGLMIHAVRSSFVPLPTGIGESIYQAGCAILTLGLNEMRATGVGRWIVLVAGFCGLAVMTMAVSYLLAVQTSLATRDSGVIKLNTAAGNPPSALVLLEHYAAIGDRQELARLVREGRDWCATVHQSHLAHPSLLYFRTTGTGAGWPAALGAMIDLALIIEFCLDDQDLRGPAIMLEAESTRLADHICDTIGITAKPSECSPEDVEQLIERLAAAGYSIRMDVDVAALAERRAAKQSDVEAIAAHLGKPGAPLLSARI